MGKDNDTQDETIVVRPHPADPLGVRVDVITDRKPVHVDWGDGSKRDKVRRPGRKPAQHSYPEPGSYRITAFDDDGNPVAHQQTVVRSTIDLQGIEVDEDDGILVSFTDEVDDGTNVLPYYRIQWPDGDIEHVRGVPGRQVRHEVIPGQHDVRIVDTTTGRVSWYDVEVSEEEQADPDFTVGPAREDETGMTVVLRLTHVQDHPVHIWWDDADGPQSVERPQQGMEIPHRYTHPGHYMQTVSYAGKLSFATTKSEAMTVPTRRETDDASAAGEEPADVRPDASDGAVRGAGGDRARPAASGTGAVGDLNTPVGQFPPQPADDGDAHGNSADRTASGNHPDSDGDPAVVNGDAPGQVEPAPVVNSDDTEPAAAQETTG